MNQPNILYIVLDAFRADAVQSTEVLQSLANENVYFKEAITPATWSLPAHASLLTGTYPHEHGVTRSGDKPDSLELVETLNSRGYTTFGVSGNPFFSQSQGFSTPFDEFWYTPLIRFIDGVDVSNYPELSTKFSDLMSTLDKEAVGYIGSFLGDLVRHDHSLKSLGNLLYALGIQLEFGKLDLGNFKHPFLDNSLAYCPEKNTAIITDLFQEVSSRADPFFIFANYMDTHDPYFPPREFRPPEVSDIKWAEARRINESLNSWEFSSDDPDESKLSIFRDLYAGEVRTVDHHIGQLVSSIEKHGLADETVVIITADHGQNLGETDRRGRRRVGHISSLSDHLVKVPLIIVHPTTDSQSLTRPVSTKDVARSIIDQRLITQVGVDASAIKPEDDIVLCEAPARGGAEVLTENRPEVTREVIYEESERDVILGKRDEWLVISSSSGKNWAWEDGEATDYESSPRALRVTIQGALEKLERHRSEEGLSESAIQRLQELGYV